MIHRDLEILWLPELQAWMDRTRRFELQKEKWQLRRIIPDIIVLGVHNNVA